MKLLELEKNTVPKGEMPDAKKREAVDRLLKDMQADVSSFFFLPKNSDWEKERAAQAPRLSKLLKDTRYFLHLGIGGSGLGAETLIRALQDGHGPEFFFLDNIDPDYLARVKSKVDPKHALIYLVSKSGNTMETLAQFFHLFSWMAEELGEEAARERVVVCTDAAKNGPKGLTKNALRELAEEWKLPCFSIPPNLGGRFSALSAVGLFPAMAAGINEKELLAGAREAMESLHAELSKGNSSLLELASQLLTQHEKSGRNITVLMPYSQLLKPLSAWFTQLWAESLGKEGRGMTPVPAVGATDQHSILQMLRDGPQDKVVGFIEVKNFQNTLTCKWARKPAPSAFALVDGVNLSDLMAAEFNATRQVLTNNKRPNFTLALDSLSARSLGGLIQWFETLTAMTGYLMGINPFDQPGVEEGKILTQQALRG